MTRTRALLALLALAGCALMAGCGGGRRQPAASTTKSATSTPTPAAQLQDAVRRAIDEEHSLSVHSLWTNRLPTSPTAIGGPSLAVLRRSVAARRHAGVRVRVLSERFRIVSVRLDPSYASATAIVVEDQRVQPTFANGQPRAKSSAAHERVRLDLHRAGKRDRFLVWKVTLLK